MTVMGASGHILVVDDDPDIRGLLTTYLEKAGFKVTGTADGKGLKRILERKRIDLIILDLILPGEDGLVLCRNLRARSNVPVIILSSRGEDMDRIIGLEMGADDYIAKPFNHRELLARVKSVLRRSRSLPDDVLDTTEDVTFNFAGWTLEGMSRQLISPELDVVPLSGSEHNLLRIFLHHPNRVLSRDQLLDLSMGKDSDHFDRTIDMQVSRLRKRLRDDPKKPALIKTVRSAGYVFCARVERARDIPQET